MMAVAKICNRFCVQQENCEEMLQTGPNKTKYKKNPNPKPKQKNQTKPTNQKANRNPNNKQPTAN